jgi:hypothetical protein
MCFFGFNANKENAEAYWSKEIRNTKNANSPGKKEVMNEDKIAKIITFLSNFSLIMAKIFMELKSGLNKLVFMLNIPR